MNKTILKNSIYGRGDVVPLFEQSIERHDLHRDNLVGRVVQRLEDLAKGAGKRRKQKCVCGQARHGKKGGHAPFAERLEQREEWRE